MESYSIFRDLDRTQCTGTGAAIGFSDRDGRNRCYPADVLRRSGDESEGPDEDRFCGISDRMYGCICSFGRRNIIIHGILRSGTLGL